MFPGKVGTFRTPPRPDRTTRPRAGLGALLLAGALLLPASAQAQTIQGTLRDRESDRPIGFGRLVLLTEAGDSVASALANPEGLFSIRARERGSYYLKASALGYKETTAGIFDLEEGSSMTVQFRIYSAPITLEGIVASVPERVRPAALIRNGFFERMTTGLGQFITPADIDKAQGLRPTDLLFNIPRVTVSSNADGSNSITMLAPLGSCAPVLYVDGMLVSRAPTDQDMPPLTAIEAIEVYRGAAETPLQWGGTAAQGCGVLVVWTKGS